MLYYFSHQKYRPVCMYFIFIFSSIAKVAPIGIVISSLTWWRGEWIGLTICINLFAFLDEILSLKIAKNPSENSLNTLSPLAGNKNR